MRNIDYVIEQNINSAEANAVWATEHVYAKTRRVAGQRDVKQLLAESVPYELFWSGEFTARNPP